MPFDEFLHLTRTIKILYGREQARDLFMKNYRKYYNLNEIFVLPAEFEKTPLQSA